MISVGSYLCKESDYFVSHLIAKKIEYLSFLSLFLSISVPYAVTSPKKGRNIMKTFGNNQKT